MNIEEWQRGNDSELSSLQRIELHNIWLQEQHKEVRDMIINKLQGEVEEKEVVGFPNDYLNFS